MPGANDLDLSGGKNPREALQALIRAEVGRQHPTEVARRPLELIAETYVRVIETNGAARYEVVDEKGQLRARADAHPLTVQDLIAELRTKHPTLFESPPEEVGAKTDSSAPLVPSPPVRDWLVLSSNDSPAGPKGWAAQRDRLGRVARRSGVMLQELRARVRPAAGRAVWRIRALPRKLPLPQTQAAVARLKSRMLPLRPLYAFGAVSGAVALLILGSLIGRIAITTRDSTTRVRSASVAAAPAPTEPATTGAVGSDSANVGNATAGAPAAVTLAGVPEVIDTSTLRLDGKLVRLFGIEWARGGQSDDLVRYLRGRATTCRPVGATEVYRCQVDGRDLSEVVLYNGGGRATPDASADLVAAENHAKAEKIGVWRKQPAPVPPAAN